MSENPPLGEQQLEVLRFVSEHSPISANDVAKRFGESRGLARTTVLTVMERLRKKGYLARVKQSGVFLYSPRMDQAEILGGLVRNFVEKTLGGSLFPFVAYLGEAKNLSKEEIDALRRRVEEIEARQASGLVVEQEDQ